MAGLRTGGWLSMMASGGSPFGLPRTPRLGLPVGMRLSQVKGLFFDRVRTRRALDSMTYYYLSHKAGLIRLVARRSMRRRKGPSAPGQPPHVHSGELRSLLWYAFDRGRRSVIVGPYGFKRGGRLTQGPPVPELHEFGGDVVKMDRKGRTRHYHYPARPYMGPALEKAEEREGDLWADAWARAVGH